MNVLVNGIGNIGTTVLHFLIRYKKAFAIDRIFALKHNLRIWQESDINQLREMGVEVCSSKGAAGLVNLNDVFSDIHYVFDTGSNGSGIRNKTLYDQMPNLIGACAQGSEKEFGVPFITGLNNELIKGAKWVHVVSCNTHGSAALLAAFCGSALKDLKHADFVVVRRSEDIGNHERLVSASVAARHLSDVYGTHHAIDVSDLFKTLGVDCYISSSDITTPSQLMHSVRFNMSFSSPKSSDQIRESIRSNPYLSVTKKFDSNVVFERGRRHGFQGRIFSHAIVLENNLLIQNNSVKGWAFVPQEGNTILSTLHAFLLQTNHPACESVFSQVMKENIAAEW